MDEMCQDPLQKEFFEKYSGTRQVFQGFSGSSLPWMLVQITCKKSLN